MSTRHWLNITLIADDPEDPEYDFTIECSDPPACPGWQECDRFNDGEHNSEDYDGEDEKVIHGVLHTYRYGWGWTVPYPGCPVQGIALEGDDHHDIARTHGPGRHEVETDWDDEYCRLAAIEDARTPDPEKKEQS